MKTIQLNHGATLSLPEDWTEIADLKQRLQAFRLLADLIDGTITPFRWKTRVLLMLTGYSPSHKRSITPKQRENINFNLVRLADSLDFAFTIDDDTRRISLNYNLYDCPVPADTYFRRERLIQTNLTARQFADMVELLSAIGSATDADERRYYQDRLCITLAVHDCDADDADAVRLAVTIYATGIALFWQQHPLYSVLYESAGNASTPAHDNTATADGHLSLGMQEVILELTQHGYGNPDHMPLTDFMDAQVKLLRDNLRQAKAAGTKLPDIAKQTGLSLATITRLL